MNSLEGEWLLVQAAIEIPRGDVAEPLVVAQRLAVGGLALGPEVPAARLGPVQRVAAHELGQLEKVGDAAGLLQRLVECHWAIGAGRYLDPLPVLLAQRRD